MPRIRTVKPELFLDDALGVLSGDHTVLFVGLWTLADKEGRLADRPARIKASIFPYRSVDADALLDDLERIGKVIRYDVDGERFIAIPGFTKHQRPHPKEPASTIPEPSESVLSREKKRQAAERFSVIPSSPVTKEGKGREGVLDPPPTTEPVVVVEVDSVPFELTPDGLWKVIQHCRERRGLTLEGAPPKGFESWAKSAIRDTGFDDTFQTLWDYLRDDTIRAKGHPTAVFISGVWNARRPAPAAAGAP